MDPLKAEQQNPFISVLLLTQNNKAISILCLVKKVLYGSTADINISTLYVYTSRTSLATIFNTCVSFKSVTTQGKIKKVEEIECPLNYEKP